MGRASSVKKLLAASITVVVIALAAASCSAPDGVEIRIQATPYVRRVYERVAAQFSQAHPGAEVEFSAGPRDEDQMVEQFLRSKLVGGALPDVVFVSGNLVRILADRGLAVALDDFIATDKQWQQGEFAPAVATAGRVGDRTYGLAFGFSMPVVLFNSELLRRAGVDAKALPATWRDIVSLAQRINDPAAGILGGFLEYDNGGAFSFLFLLDSYGGQLLTRDERGIAFNDAPGLRALEVLRDFGIAGQARVDMTRDQARQAFGAGALGILVTMSSAIPRMEAASAGRFTVLSAPLPLEAQDARVPTAGPVAVMLTRQPDRQRVAFEMMKFACGPVGQDILAAHSGYAPANEVAIGSSPTLRAALATRKNAHSYLAHLQEATGWYAPPGASSIKITDIIVTHLQRVVTLRQAPDDALEAMSAEISPLLPK